MAFSSPPPQLASGDPAAVSQWSTQLIAWLAAQDFSSQGQQTETPAVGEWELPTAAANKIWQWDDASTGNAYPVRGDLHSTGGGNLWLNPDVRSPITLIDIDLSYTQFTHSSDLSHTIQPVYELTTPTLLMAAYLKHTGAWTPGTVYLDVGCGDSLENIFAEVTVSGSVSEAAYSWISFFGAPIMLTPSAAPFTVTANASDALIKLSWGYAKLKFMVWSPQYVDPQ